MHIQLKNAGVTLPDFWDEEKAITALTTLDTYNLYSYFGCTNSTSFTRLMKPHFPNRPPKMSYSVYVRGLLADSNTHTNSETNTEPKPEEYYYPFEIWEGPEGRAWVLSLTSEERKEVRKRRSSYLQAIERAELAKNELQYS